MKTYSISDQDADYSLWLLLIHTRDAIGRLRRKELQQLDINGRQAATLRIIHLLGDNATPTEVSRWLFREPHSVSEILTRMQKNGLIRRVDSGRKNRVRILLTEKGREANNHSTKRESIHKIMSCLCEQERQQLQLLLQKLRDRALEELGVHYYR